MSSDVSIDLLLPELPAVTPPPASAEDVERLRTHWKIDLGVSVERILQRVVALLDQGIADGTHLTQALKLGEQAYRKWKSARKTKIVVDGRVGYVWYILDNYAGQGVSRSVFWQRLKTVQRKKLKIGHELFVEMLTLPESEWHGRMGSGRSRSFVYDGAEFVDQVGQAFPSIVWFLKAIGKADLKSTVHSRLKAGWKLDDAVTEPVSTGPGRVYRATSRTTGKAYVGLTTTSVEMRWSHHVKNAARGSLTPFAVAIRDHGADDFEVEVIEEVSEHGALAAREIYWIGELNTLEPHGFNRLTGGQVGGAAGRRTEYGGRQFRSLKQAASTLAAEHDVPEHIAATRIQKGLPIPGKPRSVQRHPDAVGTSPLNDLWRLHKSLWNRVKKGKTSGPVDLAWEVYDRFKADVLPSRTPGTELFQARMDEPLGPQNFRWTDRKTIVAATQGRKLVAEGREYDTVADFAKATGIATSTVLFRLSKGMTGDEVLAAGSNGPTSAKEVVFEGHKFNSKYAAARFAAQKYGMTVERARDRIRRGVPFQIDISVAK